LIPVVARTLRPVFVPVDEQPHGNVMNIERSSPGSAVANATILDEANNRQDVAPSFSARAWPRRAPASTHFELGKSADPRVRRLDDASKVSATFRSKRRDGALRSDSNDPGAGTRGDVLTSRSSD
jgi:hypothetical protein